MDRKHIARNASTSFLVSKIFFVLTAVMSPADAKNSFFSHQKFWVTHTLNNKQ